MRKVIIKEGLFFPSDFKKLPQKTAIFIKDGIIIDIRKAKTRRRRNEKGKM